jgi:hypothetical protein
LRVRPVVYPECETDRGREGEKKKDETLGQKEIKTERKVREMNQTEIEIQSE